LSSSGDTEEIASARHTIIEGGPPRPSASRAVPVSARVRELAHVLLSDSGLSVTPPDRSNTEALWQWRFQAAQTFMRYLHSPQFSYTLDFSDLPPLGSEGDRVADPIEHFLFTTRRGHCEFFAAAMASLCRGANVPARIVIGYAAWEYDESAKAYEVVEANAHAWVEVYVGDGRWVTFDPTPAASLLRILEAEGGIAARLRRLYDRAGGAWSRTIVGYDAGLQADLARSTRESEWSRRGALALDAVREWMEGVNRAFYFGPAGYIYLVFVGVVFIVALLALMTIMRRSRRIRRVLRLERLRGAEYHRLLMQLGFYLDVLEVLRRADLAKPHWQPPLDYATALTERHPNAARLVRDTADGGLHPSGATAPARWCRNSPSH
jgi:protein-glutamine gamma-glutamyltransferase